MREMVLHNWEYDIDREGYYCAPMPSCPSRGERCHDCGVFVGDSELYRFSRGESLNCILWASLNFLADRRLP